MTFRGIAITAQVNDGTDGFWIDEVGVPQLYSYVSQDAGYLVLGDGVTRETELEEEGIFFSTPEDTVSPRERL